MFAKSISGLEITSQAADYAFANIKGDQFGGDCSFLATLRILLHERAGDMSIQLKYGTSSYSRDTAEGSEPDALVRDILSGRDYKLPGILQIVSFSSGEDVCNALFRALDSDSARERTLSGFEELEDLSKFLGQRKFRTRFFVNHETKSTVIFAERMDFKRWHLLQSLIPRYMPWFFEGENKLTPDEFEFIKSLTNKESDAYETLADKLAQKFDLRSAMLREQFRGFETRADKMALDSIRNNIESTKREISRLHETYATLYARVEDYYIRQFGLEEKIRRGDCGEESDFLKYLLSNKAFNLVNINDSRIEFIITTRLSNFDPEAADRMIANKNSYLYDYLGGTPFSKNTASSLLRAIFQDETIKLRLCAAFSVDFASGRYSGLEDYNYPANIRNSYLPNQHTHRYGCLGGNERVIEQAMMEKDYVGVVAACIAAAANMGMGDITVGRHFAKEFFQNRYKIYELPDGTLATPEEALRWLEANGKA